MSLQLLLDMVSRIVSPVPQLVTGASIISYLMRKESFSVLRVCFYHLRGWYQ